VLCKAFGDVFEHLHVQVFGKELLALVLLHGGEAQQGAHAVNLRQDEVGDAIPVVVDLQGDFPAGNGDFFCAHGCGFGKGRKSILRNLRKLNDSIK